MNRDVVIVGGGVNGASIAYNLAKMGDFSITLLEKKYVTGGSTGKCGGGIRTQFTTRESCEIAAEGARLFDSLGRELDYDIELRKGGYLILAHSDKELEDFRNNVKLQNSAGVPSRILGIDDIKNFGVEPFDAAGASFCSLDGVANPFRVSFGYRDRAREMGADIRTHEEVRGASCDGKKFTITTDKEEYNSDFLVNAAGYESRDIAAMLGVDLPIEPYKHEIFATEAVDHFLDPMLMSFRKNFYISQTERGELVGGYSPLEEKPNRDLTPTLAFAVRAKKLIAEHLKQINSMKLLRHWAGHYDVTPDAMPILGPARYEGFIQANGFSGHGFMLSPFVGRAVACRIAGKTDYDRILKNFSFERFKREIKRERGVVG